MSKTEQFTSFFNIARKLKKIFHISIILLFANAIAETEKNKFSESLDQIIAPLSQKSSLAIILTDLKSPSESIYKKNESIYLQPASTLKVLTAIIAKKNLKKKKPFKSTLTAYGKMKSTTLKGNLILDIAANPDFTEENLREMVHHISKSNIKKINGDIIILSKRFDDIEKIPGTYWDEVDDCYAASVSDISINKNCFLGTLFQTKNGIKYYWPQEKHTINLEIQIKKDCSEHKNIHTHFPAHGYGVHLNQNPFEYPETLKGCWSKHIDHIQLKRSIKNPKERVINSIKKYLEKEKIQLGGKIYTTKENPIISKKSLWQIKKTSSNLDDLIETMLTKSDNHIANQLFKESAHVRQKKIISWEDAQENADEVLKSLDLYDKDASIVDGAGLSRNNKITALQLQKSLIAIYTNKDLKNLIALFATKDNARPHLKNRLQKFKSPLYVKSGSLKGTTGLIGFIDPYGKNPKAFTIIINGNKSVARDYFSIEKSLLSHLINMQSYNKTKNNKKPDNRNK